MTGSCDGLAELRESLAAHPELDLRGWCEDIEEAAGLLARGPAAVLHATADQEPLRTPSSRRSGHTDAPVVLLTATTHLPELWTSPSGRHPRPDEADRIAAVVGGLRGGSQRTDARPRPQNRVFTVFSPKGGTGKSVIATNLAVALAANGVSDAARRPRPRARRRRADAGQRPAADDLRPRRRARVRSTRRSSAATPTRHASGLDVLPAPLRPEQAELVTEEKVARILDVAARRLRRGRDRHAGVVPRNGARGRSTARTPCCSSASSTWRRSRTSGSRLRRSSCMRFPDERISLVLNQPSPTRAMKRSELEAALGIARAVRGALRRRACPARSGSASRSSSRRGGFARAVSKMAGELVPQAVEARPGRSAAEPQNGNGDNGKQRRWPLRKG